MKTFFYGFLVIVFVVGVVAWSGKNDEVRNNAFDNCLEIAQANALPIPEYLVECMD